MKILIFTTLLLAGSLWAYGSSFCAGFSQGYKEGYCHGKWSCIAPIPPICPIPKIGEDNYTGGYNRGFLMGLNAQ